MHKNKIGFVHMWSAVASGIMGVSLIALPNNLHQMSLNGHSTYLAWVLCIPAILSFALLFGRLSMIYPGLGGPYGYISRIYGELVGKIMGYMYLFMITVQNTAVLTILNASVAEALKLVSMEQYQIPATIVLAVSAGYTYFLNFATTGRINTIITCVKFAPIIALFLAALPETIDYVMKQKIVYPDLQNFLPSIASPLAPLLFAFGGLEFSTVNKVEDIESPEKTVPSAILWGTVTAMIVFFSLQCMVSAHARYAPIDSLLMTDLANHMLFEGAGNLLLVSSVLLAWYATSFGFTTTGHLTEHLKITDKHGIALTTIATIVTWMAITLWINSPLLYEMLITAADLVSLVVFAVCAAGYCLIQSHNKIIGIASIIASCLFAYCMITTEIAYLLLQFFAISVVVLFCIKKFFELRS